MPTKKNTVTVTMSWFASSPTFAQALKTVEQELPKRTLFMTEAGLKVLGDLLPHNGGKPFEGETVWGPHTRIWFEAKNLAEAVLATEVIELVLKGTYPNGMGKDTGGIYVRYAGMVLIDLLESLETALANAQRDLKATRCFLPSKNVRRLRTVFESLRA